MILRGRGCHCLKRYTSLSASRGKSFGLFKWGFALRLPRQNREPSPPSSAPPPSPSSSPPSPSSSSVVAVVVVFVAGAGAVAAVVAVAVGLGVAAVVAAFVMRFALKMTRVHFKETFAPV